MRVFYSAWFYRAGLNSSPSPLTGEGWGGGDALASRSGDTPLPNPPPPQGGGGNTASKLSRRRML